jgi:hypothetical protein
LKLYAAAFREQLRVRQPPASRKGADVAGRSKPAARKAASAPAASGKAAGRPGVSGRRIK